MRWPDGKYGDNYGGWGDTEEEARAKKWKAQQERDERRKKGLEGYEPQLYDISDDGQTVAVGWWRNGEWVSARFSFEGWNWPPLKVRQEFLHPYKSSSSKKAAKPRRQSPAKR